MPNKYLIVILLIIIVTVVWWLWNGKPQQTQTALTPAISEIQQLREKKFNQPASSSANQQQLATPNTLPLPQDLEDTRQAMTKMVQKIEQQEQELEQKLKKMENTLDGLNTQELIEKTDKLITDINLANNIDAQKELEKFNQIIANESAADPELQQIDQQFEALQQEIATLK